MGRGGGANGIYRGAWRLAVTLIEAKDRGHKDVLQEMQARARKSSVGMGPLAGVSFPVLTSVSVTTRVYLLACNL